ncbi:MAG: hypothetical protein IJX20_04175 [Alphaproteobacteria bacterium]|nr:hypothetical protein [Alphaproteobacteria bacterium]
MNKFLMICVWACLVSGTVKAETVSFHFGGGEASVTTETSGELYNFSPELLEAVKNCSVYQENFTKNNPKNVEVPFVGKVDLDVNVDIKGWAGDNCLFAMDYKLLGVQNIVYDCALSRQQVDEVYNAMTDKSGEILEETYTSYYEYGEVGKPLNKAPQQTTIKGTRFDILAAKIMNQYCVSKHNEPTKEEQEEASKKQSALSEDFKKALLVCAPAKDSKNMMMINMEAEIIGMENDKCHVKYEDFDLYIPMLKMADITSWVDIMELCEDATISKYTPNYYTDGAMFALYDCMQGNSVSGSSSMRTNNVERGFNAKHEENKCILTFVNKVKAGDEVLDYSKICEVNVASIAVVLQPYETLIQNNKGINEDGHYSSHRSDEQTRKADKEIFELLEKSGVCTLIGNAEN